MGPFRTSCVQLLMRLGTKKLEIEIALAARWDPKSAQNHPSGIKRSNIIPRNHLCDIPKPICLQDSFWTTPRHHFLNSIWFKWVVMVSWLIVDQSLLSSIWSISNWSISLGSHWWGRHATIPEMSICFPTRHCINGACWGRHTTTPKDKKLAS